MDKSYCFFGDSITQAAYVKMGWVNHLKIFLEEKYIGDFINVFNLGISGNTTSDILNRFEAESLPRYPSSIIFAVGINDTKSGSETQFRNNLITITHKAKEFTKDITFVGLVLGKDIEEENFSLIKTKNYDLIIKDVAKLNKCLFVDLFDKLEPSDFLDGLHPNDEGHKKMFEEIKKYF